jgi:serine/threonine protein kinase
MLTFEMARPGEVLEGKYRLIRLVGRGGMGVVYEALHEQIGKQVAVKILRSELATDPNVVARFQREAQAAAAIGHRCIVDVYDIGITPERDPFLVMEFVDGGSYGALLREQRQLELPFVAYVACQTLSALGAAHAKGIVHRDLKPDNILLAASWRGAPDIKLLDFGISKIMNAAACSEGALTVAGAVMGSPHYLSPEQARGLPDLDHRVDLYAMGVILYRSLTGRVPFDARGYPDLLMAIVQNDVPSPALERPDLPSLVVETILKALEKDPARRHQTAEELATELLPLVDPSYVSRISFSEIPVTPTPQSALGLGAAYPGTPRPLPGTPIPAYAGTPPGAEPAPVPATVVLTPTSAPGRQDGTGPQTVASPRETTGPQSTVDSQDVTGPIPTVSPEEGIEPHSATVPPSVLEAVPGKIEGSRGGRKWLLWVMLLLLLGVIGGMAAVFGWHWRSQGGNGATMQILTSTPPESQQQPTEDADATREIQDGSQGDSHDALVTSQDAHPATDGASREASSAGDAGPRHGDAPSAIKLSVAVHPRHAKIFVDDAAVRENPFKGRFPRDDLSHRVRAEARGYRPAGEVVVFDQDRHVKIRLRRIRPGPVRPEPTGPDYDDDPWAE